MLAAASGPSPSTSPSAGPVGAFLDRPPCWKHADGACRWVSDRTGSHTAGTLVDWLLAKPVMILFIVLLAVIARGVLHRLITRTTFSIAEGTVPGVIARASKRSPFLDGPLLSERRKQRAETMGSVLRSITTGAVICVALLMILGEVGLNTAPLIASAGILGVALGFGAQTLVKDFLSGIFLVIEDQYGVGDVVDLGSATGVVEAVGLRVTRLRDVNGAVWYVRNGEVLRVGNMSQGWARAVLDVQVAYTSDIDQVKQILADVSLAMRNEDDWRELITEDPEVWGVEALSAEAVVVRLVIKTEPLKQWDVARELRRRIKGAFDAAGVSPPTSRTMWVGASPGGPTDGPPVTVAAADVGGGVPVTVHADGVGVTEEELPPARAPKA